MIYREWEDGFMVRRMRAEDAKIVQRWYSQYCPMACDLDVVLASYPAEEKGFYIGEYQGEVVASAIRIPACEGVYYGSYYYVEEKWRGKGFGRRLRDEVAAAHVGNNVLCIDAMDNLEAMNKRKGYTTASFQVVLYKGAAIRLQREHPSDIKVTPVSDVDFNKVIEYDSECFVGPNSPYRRAFLERWFAIPGGKSLTALDKNGQVIGLACRRPAFEGPHHKIGPMYAKDLDTAHALLQELTADLDAEKDTIWFSICESNEDAKQLVKDMQMQDDIHLVRMYLNGDPKEFKKQVFAITSIDICGF
ncbi:hypothetical protein CAPTEDRAFT_206392 [Capitella teleta]|uniref:N-acetyltransferase domain-containing protein n=1 Tax=Capitella teleta TaxID=283909 RepID=R7TG46_CAPTE|nr:hypothetical protein CAPTEDRAFT_206392 [Capitella teleta]|eukprot:ELT90021.1 hypothetical protein CAPTEDRAFT_206392 [Capitella teleta]